MPEERGRIEEAVALLRQYRREGDPHAAFELAEFLARHGRHDEAIEILGPAAETAGGDSDWIIDLLCRIFVEADRADEALAYMDDHFARHGGHPDEHACARAQVVRLCSPPETVDTDPSPRTVPAKDRISFGTLGGVVAVAERLVHQGDPVSRDRHRLGCQDSAKRSPCRSR
ncbi:tetratricopeptide repeat protein [Streptomyces sp. NPDC048411]|uniref:tetratricopeptide repeat protein n=1 Tax=Streptomyces sp. NPDC048411 TaxID=3157206 RepID=UPI0034558C3E